MSDPDRMIPIADVPVPEMTTPMSVTRDYGTVYVGIYRLDLDGIGQLQVALDQAVRDIRGYQARQA